MEFGSLINIIVICIFIYFITSIFLGKSSKKKNNRSKSSIKDVIDIDAEELLNSQKEQKIRKQTIQKKYKAIAKFYNNYKFIDYSDPKNKKILTKQMNDIINVVDKNLNEASELSQNTSYRMLLVGMITFKHLTKEKFIEVNNDLNKLYKLGHELEFNTTFMSALGRVINDENELGI